MTGYTGDDLRTDLKGAQQLLRRVRANVPPMVGEPINAVLRHIDRLLAVSHPSPDGPSPLLLAEEAERLVREALHLRMYGECAPGGNETWRDWEREAEAWHQARYSPGGDDGRKETSTDR